MVRFLFGGIPCYGPMASVEIRKASTFAEPNLAENGILFKIQSSEKVVVRNVPNVVGQQSAERIAGIRESGQVGPKDGFMVAPQQLIHQGSGILLCQPLGVDDFDVLLAISCMRQLLLALTVRC